MSTPETLRELLLGEAERLGITGAESLEDPILYEAVANFLMIETILIQEQK